MWEGEAPPEATQASEEVIRCWNMMNNGMGGIEWEALPVAVELYGIHDVEGLVAGLLVVKGHKPAVDESGGEE